ncbi:hypothetical protein [Streptomyces cyaneofuscatus]|uniref:hypothetical protein n=1 Tax=Streptomyces cyaneofuscatus TaxID=66883 RepID=UPI0036D83FF3
MTTLVSRDPRTGLRHGPVRWPDGSPPPPYGCRRCGYDSPLHGASGHRYELPTRAQVAARLAALSTSRTARIVGGFPKAPACDAMNHNSVGSERFCELDARHGPDEDHDSGDMTWPVED